MKITDLISLLNKELHDSGDVEVVMPMDTGQYAMVASLSTEPLFLHDGFEPVYDPYPLARQNKSEHQHVVVLSWDEKDVDEVPRGT